MKTKKNSKKNSPKDSSYQFVVRFHSNIVNSDHYYDSPMFYSESGQGWVSDVESATRYDSVGADKIMLNLLKGEKIASELVNLNDKPEHTFSHNTVFTGVGNTLHIITNVPQFYGDNYKLDHHDPSKGWVSEDWSETDLFEMIESENFTVIWDSEQNFVPDDNETWLKGLVGK